jgi:hypothetical protein
MKKRERERPEQANARNDKPEAREKRQRKLDLDVTRRKQTSRVYTYVVKIADKALNT